MNFNEWHWYYKVTVYFLIPYISYSILFIVDAIEVPQWKEPGDAIGNVLAVLLWPMAALFLLTVLYVQFLKYSKVKFKEYKLSFYASYLRNKEARALARTGYRNNPNL